MDRRRLVSLTLAASSECDTTPMRMSKKWISFLICCRAALIFTSGEVSCRPESLDSKDSLSSSSFSVSSANSLVSLATASCEDPVRVSSSSSRCFTSMNSSPRVLYWLLRYFSFMRMWFNSELTFLFMAWRSPCVSPRTFSIWTLLDTVWSTWALHSLVDSCWFVRSFGPTRSNSVFHSTGSTSACRMLWLELSIDTSSLDGSSNITSSSGPPSSSSSAMSSSLASSSGSACSTSMLLE
mmetsp:Transcript_16837/g.23168  ORF Transcript_16837/g.23168 Transcript_16837/m.23168 type:complete len:239 (+) Transcript_16837:161-877(+)